MKRSGKKEIRSGVLFAVAAVLLVALIVLVCILIFVVSGSTLRGDSFDIDMITPGGGDYDISGVFIPEFVGISSEGRREGVSTPENIVADLYGSISPTVAYILSEGEVRVADTDEWNSFARLDGSIYIKLHSSLPMIVVGLFAGERNLSKIAAADVYEMFVIPYSETSGEMSLAVRSTGGDVFICSVSEPRTFLTDADMANLMTTYSSSLVRFEFAAGSIETLEYTEPVCLEGIEANNIIVSNNTAPMVFSTPFYINSLLDTFGMNPDKATEQESEGGRAFVDHVAVLYVRASSFEYRATADGGIMLRDITGAAGDVADIAEYIRATVAIFEQIKKISVNFTGGDAGTYISSVSSVDGEVTVTLEYAFDNIPLAGADPAIRTVFKDGRLTETDVYTLSVRRKGSRSTTIPEWSFAEHIGKRGIAPRSIGAVYKADFTAESVRVEWSAKVAAEPVE